MIIVIIIIMIVLSRGASNMNSGHTMSALADFAIAGGLGYLVWHQMQHREEMDKLKVEMKK